MSTFKTSLEFLVITEICLHIKKAGCLNIFAWFLCSMLNCSSRSSVMLSPSISWLDLNRKIFKRINAALRFSHCAQGSSPFWLIVISTYIQISEAILDWFPFEASEITSQAKKWYHWYLGHAVGRAHFRSWRAQMLEVIDGRNWFSFVIGCDVFIIHLQLISSEYVTHGKNFFTLTLWVFS